MRTPSLLTFLHFSTSTRGECGIGFTETSLKVADHIDIGIAKAFGLPLNPARCIGTC